MNKSSVSELDCLIMNQDTVYPPNRQNYMYTHKGSSVETQQGKFSHFIKNQP